VLAVPTLVLGLTLVAFGATLREAATAALTGVAGLVLLRLARPRLSAGASPATGA
jgi:hypothetical protein